MGQCQYTQCLRPATAIFNNREFCNEHIHYIKMIQTCDIIDLLLKDIEDADSNLSCALIGRIRDARRSLMNLREPQ